MPVICTLEAKRLTCNFRQRKTSKNLPDSKEAPHKQQSGGKTFDLKFQAEKEAKENRQREIDDRVKERREAAKRMRPIERTAEQNACMRTACMMSSHTT